MNSKLGELLAPKKLELVAYSVISVMVMLMLLGLNYVRDVSPVLASSTTNTLSGMLQGGLLNLDQLPFANFVSLYAFWYVFGILVFSVLLYVVRGASDLKSDILVSINYHHPRNFSHAKFWTGIILHAIYHFVLVAIVLATSYLFIVFGEPVINIALDEIVFSGKIVNVLVSLAVLFGFLMLALIWLGITIRSLFMRRVIF